MSSVALRTLRVAVVPERYGRVLSPCASIRLTPFFEAIRGGQGVEVRYLLASEIRRFSPDLVVWHRVSIPDSRQLAVLADLRASRGTRLVFDLDDNLLDLEGHGEQASYQATAGSVRMSLAMSDEVWTSTPRLASRAARETPAKIRVMPNALDPELWALPRAANPPQPAGKPLKLLYMGTRTHDADFGPLEQALTILDQQQPGSVELYMIGVRAMAGSSPPWLRLLDPPPHVGASYPAFVNWFRQLSGFDLGVAPLLSNEFSDCKSPIKVLDYAAIGLPTLASIVPAYIDSLRSNVDCLHVENQPTLWAKALGDIAKDRGRLFTIAAEARELVAPPAFAKAVSLRTDSLRKLVSSG